ncbi:MAG: methionyl-tRNA formyltransferase [Evtepia sp.]|uniref:methionyl-tRNA formyltransferase n=1 Tax=Evtepia sp. TaxID=2773933 RepID=UPI002A758DC9|nr:methionyl-tRNA formyltransferase [Evtepia sp.]MDY3015137.1 methionyl-tRNA formyltransferase [Evtepia sp.]
MKILFMGTPDFAVPSLEALVGAGHELVGVFTQPDKPKNRGMKLQAPPVKVCALGHDIPVYQPTKLRDGTALECIRELAPDLIVVAAYGRILPQEILDYPKLGCINVHSSLLPKYRGAAPIHWAILNGDKETGVTIMHMALALDAGDIISQAVTPIDPNETVEMLHDRLAVMGADLLVKTVEDLEKGTATRTPQEESQVTLAPMLSRALSPMDWTRPAQQLHDQVRGLIPWPAAVTQLNGVRCKVFATALSGETTGKQPGTVIAADKHGLKLACGGGTVLEILELQADGGKRMKAADYLRGHPIAVE